MGEGRSLGNETVDVWGDDLIVSECCDRVETLFGLFDMVVLLIGGRERAAGCAGRNDGQMRPYFTRSRDYRIPALSLSLA